MGYERINVKRGIMRKKKKYIPKKPEFFKKLIEKVGRWAFAGGLGLAVIAGFFPEQVNSGSFFTALFILGLIVGWFNISDEEMTPFLVGVITLMVVGIAGLQISPTMEVMNINFKEIFDSIFRNTVIFTGSAGIVVAKKLIISSGSRPKILKKMGL